MNKENKVSLLCKVYFHFENVPKFMQKHMENEFMKNRDAIVAIYNKHVDSVNQEWDLTGEPAMLGEFIEDINPKYVKLIQDRIQPEIDVVNKRFPYCRYKLDEYGDITGYIPFIRSSKLWIDLEMIES